MKNHYLFPIGLLSLLFIIPEPAWALQPHGAPEGLYVHQMAHLLFASALVYLFLHTRWTPELSGKGWRYLQIFCILFAAWNFLALVGHEVARILTPSDFLEKSSWFGQITGPISPTKLLYFITKMDHLLYIPALICLVIALRMFSKQAIEDAAAKVDEQ